MALSGWEYTMIILLIIVVMAIIVWVLYYFVFRDKGALVNDKCNSDSDCRSGLYCSGNFTCQSGTAQKEGQRCQTDQFCEVGLTCQQNTCRATFNILFDSLPPFSNQYLVIALNSVPYYLTIGNTSFFTKSQPEIGFSYSAQNQRLINGSDIVYVDDRGLLQTVPINSLVVPDTNQFNLVIDATNRITLRDKYNNILQYTQNSTDNTYVAFFNDQVQYPESGSNIDGSNPANLILQSVPLVVT